MQKSKEKLEQVVASLEKEKEAIEAKLHSLAELRKSIHQVKIEMHQQRVQEYLARKERQKKIDAQRLANGNRGFLIKERISTFKPKVKIEVNP